MLECYHWQHNKGFDKVFYFLEQQQQQKTYLGSISLLGAITCAAEMM